MTTSALAQTDTSAASDVDEVVITATGVTRIEVAGGLMVVEDVPKTRSTVTQDYIQKQDPATDVFQLLKLLPGANTSSADPYNLNQGMLAVRGLEAGQLGFSFDGAPIQVECCYSVFPGQWIDNENTDTVVLSQGSADLASPHIGAVGGIVNVSLRTPSKQAGGLIDLSLGTEDSRRAFIRLETGRIGSTGLRAFISYSQIIADHFRGPGVDEKMVVNSAIQKDWSNGSTSKFSVSYTYLDRDTYRNPTLAQYANGGANGAASNYSPTPGDANFYRLNSNPWHNLITSMPNHIVVSEALSFDITPYYYFGYGLTGAAQGFNETGIGFGNLLVTADLNGNGTRTDQGVLTYAPIFEETHRGGVMSVANYKLGNHKLVAGYWFQRARDEVYRPLGALRGGYAVDRFGEQALILAPDGRPITLFDQDTLSTTHAILLGDTIDLMEGRLSFDLGLKQLWVEREGRNRVPSGYPNFTAKRRQLLPSAAARYKIDDKHQVYASLAKGYRVLPVASLYPRYGANNAALSTRPNPGQESEDSFIQEIGYRYQGDLINASISAFHYEFNNRLISAQVCDPGCLNQPINGGKQRGKGIDFEIGTRAIHNFRPYFSAEYLDTEIASDIPIAGDFLPTKGKESVRSPHFQAGMSVDYDDGTFFGNLGVKYTGSQYATFMNDQKIPSFTIVDVAVGFRLNDIGPIRKPELRLNVRNATDKNYLSGVAGPTTHSVATRGLLGTILPAASPTYYIGSGTSALLTLVAAF